MTFEDVVRFAKVNFNPAKHSVAIKDSSASALLFTCFDKTKNEIISTFGESKDNKYCCKGYKYQKLDDDLVQMFGDKEMLVLQ